MALTTEQENDVLSMLEAFENGKRIEDLDEAQGALSEMTIEVQDSQGESKKLNFKQAIETATQSVCGRYWNEANATPVAAGYYGSLNMLQNLPQILGLGCYLVQDDRTRRKLDATNHYLFDDGSPAYLDGSMGQYMWCWNTFYFAEWYEGDLYYMAVSLTPILGKINHRIPAGGVSALGCGVMDRTNNKLCSVVNADPQYRGGNNNASLDDTYKSQLGQAATTMTQTAWSNAARARGTGWEANWYVAQAVTEILFLIIFGNRNSQAAYTSEKDANGLYQGGLGIGVTDFCQLFVATFPYF